MIERETHSRWLHRIAVATCCAALLPITVGAIVTTMKWGMAFADWPNSDGHGMFAYPWFGSAIDKFTEHGHRLAGIVIGCLSIVLAAVAWRCERRRWVCLAATAVLACVVVQGLLGGGRVLANDPRMALLHGQFAAWVLALMGVVALVTGRGWRATAGTSTRPVSRRLRQFALALPVVVVLQSALGGWIRHLGGGVVEHLAFAAVVLGVTLVAAGLALQHGNAWLSRTAWGLLTLVVVQLLLGATAWVARFGWPAGNYVAVYGSPLQIISRTVHAVTGMLTFLASVNLAVRVVRVDWLTRRELIAEVAFVPAGQGGLA